MKRVLLGCSGGVDSSTAIKLLLQQNYEVVIVHFSTWVFEQKNFSNTKISQIKEIANHFGVKYFHEDLRDVFYEKIVCNFIQEYLSGNTPNPCVNCNRNIKFKTLFDKAKELGIDYISTGHYANIGMLNDRYFIKKGVDLQKDQSYVLWQLPQEYLQKIIFPLGVFCKKDIKHIAKENNLYEFIDAKESEDICFLPKGDYRALIREEKHEEVKKLKNGNFIFEGKIVGKHEGYPFYTIGQRTGLGVALGFPVFVEKIDKNTNEIFLGRNENLWKDEMLVSNLNFQKYETVKNGFQCLAKIRYNDIGHKCQLTWVDEKTIKVHFSEKVRAITKGQSAVFYENDDIVVGGIIV